MLIDQLDDAPEWSYLTSEGAKDGYYTDCFVTAVSGQVTLAQFIEAFYKTPLFRAERLILRLFAKSESTDQQVDDLAAGRGDRFAVWSTQARACDQILLDAGSTKSCLMVAPAGGLTRLYFGSVVVPEPAKQGKPPRLGPVFDTLLGAHKVYSRMLLSSAARKFRG